VSGGTYLALFPALSRIRGDRTPSALQLPQHAPKAAPVWSFPGTPIQSFAPTLARGGCLSVLAVDDAGADGVDGGAVGGGDVDPEVEGA
jgi:hypothetical protein